MTSTEPFGECPVGDTENFRNFRRRDPARNVVVSELIGGYQRLVLSQRQVSTGDCVVSIQLPDGLDLEIIRVTRLIRLREVLTVGDEQTEFPRS